jgi:putative NADPH-quinone reductase
MQRNVLIIDGHPDARPGRLIHALAAAYRQGAEEAGHGVRTITLAELDFPLLRTSDDFEKGDPPQSIAACQDSIRWAHHIVIFFPLWLGAMPALLKGFFEQILRPGFAFEARRSGLPRKLLAGRTARIVVTMGMPGLFYKWYYRAHSLKSLERNILAFCGIESAGSTVIGMIGNLRESRRNALLERMSVLGLRAK